MEYPKKVMTIKELHEELGYPVEWLRSIYRSRHQKIAWKLDESKSNSLILFDTDELEKYRISKCTGI